MTKPRSVLLSEVKSRPTRWIWNNYIPRRHLTLLEGESASGKSWVAYDIASRLSVGAEFGIRSPQHNIYDKHKTLFFTGEDSPEEIKDRVEFLGGDGSQICVCDEVISPCDPKGYKFMQELVMDLRCRMVVFDPLMAYLGDRVNPNNAFEVRKALEPFGRLAKTTDISVLGIRHWGKSDIYTSITQKGIGSVDFLAFCRSQLAVAKIPGTECRLVSQGKCTLTKRLAPSLIFSLDDGLIWEGQSTQSVDDLIAEKKAAEAQKSKKKTVSFLSEAAKG